MTYIKSSLKNFPLENLGKFDVIYVDPPWHEYHNRVNNLPFFESKNEKYDNWDLEEIKALKISQIATVPSFLFLWVGSEHLEHGRELFKAWGFKRFRKL